jgi:prepilin-type processing-associated H-X9-DG protein
MLCYEANHGHFPGIANPILGSTSPAIAGYLPMILPYLERNDLSKEWLSGNRPTPYMAVLVCPGDPPPNTTSDYLCYVANGGTADVVGVADAEIQASGICFDRTGMFHKPIQLDMTYLNQHDGASDTLLLTENLDADHWGIDGVAKAKRWNSFVWHPDPIPPKAAFNHRATSTSRTDPSIALARPSSNHLNGVNVVFCDGHHQFLQNSIDYKVWRQMMTSNSKLWP